MKHLQEIRGNIVSALRIVDVDSMTPRDAASALWRIVDAAGLLANIAGHAASGGSAGSPTGRGYYVDRKSGAAHEGASA